MSDTRPRRVVLAAGGTGGHMFPAQALGRELISRGIAVTVLTDRRGDDFAAALPDAETHVIKAGGVAGGSLVNRARGALHLGLGLLQARRMLQRLDSEVVVGFGGYASVPTVLAAAQLRQRIVLHEQNAVVGRANRLLARHAETIATAFERVEGLAAAQRAKIRVTGNPVRPAIAELADRPYAEPALGEPFRLLVIGGSQGAVIFNTAVPDALARLRASRRSTIAISQQVRGPETERISALYTAAGIEHDLRGFFDDLPARLLASHLIIARAGASTVAELAAIGRPAILVPLPGAIDNHQTVNAQRMAEAGAAWHMPQASLTAEALAGRLESLITNPVQLARAARAAHTRARLDAASALADLVCNHRGRNGNPVPRREEAA